MKAVWFIIYCIVGAFLVPMHAVICWSAVAGDAPIPTWYFIGISASVPVLSPLIAC